MYCGNCGNPVNGRFCTSCGSAVEGSAKPQYVVVPPPQMQGPIVAQIAVPAEKSSGLAVLFTVLWPGAGHLYLGFTQKAIPYVVANVIAFLLAFTVVLLPITLVIYVVTLCLAIKTVSEDTEAVNCALREGRRLMG